MKRAAGFAALLVLAACSGEESDVPGQTQPARIEATGRVFDGASGRAHAVAAQGTAGMPRRTNTSGSGEFVLNLTDLSGPYLFSNTLTPGANPDLMELTSVATRAGVVNVTPLTTLLTAQLLGIAPGDAIVSFNDPASVDPATITDATIGAAQAELIRFLQEVYGVQVKSGTASFIDAPFSPVAGDPMYDTIQALDARIAEKGATLGTLATQVAIGVRMCRTEELALVVNGTQKSFCPFFKSAIPREEDTTIIDYVFRNVWNESLSFSARGETVLNGELVDATGATFTCDGASCGTISLGSPASDLTKPVTFTNATFTGTEGSAMANGTLVSAVPGITIPPLPCANNRFHIIFEDRSVLGDCAESNHPFNLPGVFSSPVGPGSEWLQFINGFSTLPELPRFEVVLDFSTPSPTVTSVYYVDNDVEMGGLRNRNICQGTACNGVTIGPVTVNTSFGFPIEVIPVTLEDTVLTGIDEDGRPNDSTVMIRASLIALRDPGMVLAYPPLSGCAPGADTIAAQVAGASFNMCVPQNDIGGGMINRTVTDLGDGEIQISLTTDMWDQLVLTVRNDVLVEAVVSLSSAMEQYRCPADCSGITVTPADASGERTITFGNASLRRMETFPLPGIRALTLSSGSLGIPPP